MWSNFSDINSSYDWTLQGMTVEDYNNCVEDYADGLYRFILKNIRDEEKASDIVQDSFEKLWRKVKDVDPNKAISIFLHWGIISPQGLVTVSSGYLPPTARGLFLFEIETKVILLVKIWICLQISVIRNYAGAPDKPYCLKSENGHISSL